MAQAHNNNGFTFAKALKCAGKGILLASKERNFRIDIVFAIIATVLGFVLSISSAEWLIVVACFGLVLGGETLNTAIEALVDLVSPEYHVLAGVAKDCAAGAVLLFAIASFIIGCIIFIPKILSLFFGV
jgi:diacylglycerol kinase